MPPLAVVQKVVWTSESAFQGVLGGGGSVAGVWRAWKRCEGNHNANKALILSLPKLIKMLGCFRMVLDGGRGSGEAMTWRGRTMCVWRGGGLTWG